MATLAWSLAPSFALVISNILKPKRWLVNTPARTTIKIAIVTMISVSVNARSTHPLGRECLTGLCTRLFMNGSLVSCAIDNHRVREEASGHELHVQSAWIIFKGGFVERVVTVTLLVA